MTASLRQLIDAIATDPSAATELLAASPGLATEALGAGATRTESVGKFIPALECYAYAGDTALHLAGAAWNRDMIARLLAAGADPNARNRRGATPLHYACVGNPQSPRWNPDAQAAAVTALLAAGADPDAIDKSGATPLHRAVRTRANAAVAALLAGGADPRLPTKNGSTPAKLAAIASGRGGSGSAEAKAQQSEIIRRLADATA